MIFFPFFLASINHTLLQFLPLNFTIGVVEPLGGDAVTNSNSPGSSGGSPINPSLSRVVLTLESSAARQAALQHILNALQVMFARDCVIAALDSTAAALSQTKEELHGK